MDKNRQLIYLGALLHDIGKFYQLYPILHSMHGELTEKKKENPHAMSGEFKKKENEIPHSLSNQLHVNLNMN